MRSDIILVKDKGAIIPANLVEAATSKNTSAQGVGLVHPEAGLIGEGSAKPLTLADLNSNQAEWSDLPVVYHLCESVGEVKPEDVQPFPLIVDGDTPHCLGFLSGSFSGIENDGQFSDAYVFVEQFLRPTLTSMWSGDIAKFTQAVKAKPFELTMNAMCSGTGDVKGTCVLLMSNGEATIFTKSPDALRTPWGFTSDHLGVIKEGSFPEKAEATTSTLGNLAKKIGGGIKKAVASETYRPMQPEKPVEAPKVEPAPAEGAPAVKAVPETNVKKIGGTTVIAKGPVTSDLQPKTATAVTEDLVWVQPPKDMSNRKLKDWYYKHNATVVPQNISERPPIRMLREKAQRMSSVKIVTDPKSEPIKTFSELPRGIEASKDSVSPSREAENLPVPKQVTAGPVIPVSELEKVNTILQNSKRIMDPREWQTLENKNPTFWDAHGISRERAQHLTMEAREAIARVSPQDAARGWMNADWLNYQLMQRITALEPKKVEAVAAEQPSVATRKIGGIKKVA